MTLLNERYDYGLELFLLSVDEGITGYRDDSLEVSRCHLIHFSDSEEEPDSIQNPTQGRFVQGVVRMDNGRHRQSSRIEEQL